MCTDKAKMLHDPPTPSIYGATYESSPLEGKSPEGRHFGGHFPPQSFLPCPRVKQDNIKMNKIFHIKKDSISPCPRWLILCVHLSASSAQIAGKTLAFGASVTVSVEETSM